VAGGRALDSFEGRRHDRAHEQLVDPALALFWWPAYLPHRVGRSMRQTTPPRKGQLPTSDGPAKAASGRGLRRSNF
jgi:hypothetical protein